MNECKECTVNWGKMFRVSYVFTTSAHGAQAVNDVLCSDCTAELQTDAREDERITELKVEEIK